MASRIMWNPEPKVPVNLNPLAGDILARLQSHPESGSIILGGGVALQHYCPYRPTHDIDAWWQHGPERAVQEVIQGAMDQIASEQGYELKIRRWGETESYELQTDGRTVFSFQIALRTTELEPARESSWPPVKIESFRENIASKMNALVSRGAPRDMIDIFTVCAQNLITPQECWKLWCRKNSTKDVLSARANVHRYVEQLESRRPLQNMADRREREQAKIVRDWLKKTLCQGTDHGR